MFTDNAPPMVRHTTVVTYLGDGTVTVGLFK